MARPTRRRERGRYDWIRVGTSRKWWQVRELWLSMAPRLPGLTGRAGRARVGGVGRGGEAGVFGGGCEGGGGSMAGGWGATRGMGLGWVRVRSGRVFGAGDGAGS